MIERLRHMTDDDAQDRLDAFLKAISNREDDPRSQEAAQASLMAASVYRGPAVVPDPPPGD